MSAGALATAIIAAAGSGERLGAGGPKALVQVGGQPLLAWSLAALRQSRLVGHVVVAAPAGLEDEVRALAPAAVVVAGGATRSESVLRALREVDSDIVAIHDAARPLASGSLFDAVISELRDHPECDGVIAAERVADTLKRARDGCVSETVSRDGLWAAQTPQAFRTAALIQAAEAGAEALTLATDDASLVEKAGGVVRVHEARDPNLKVTRPGDLSVAEALLTAMATSR